MGKDYIAQLSKWARWMLPRQEAEDVIADYHDIVGSPPRPREELFRDLGKPHDVVKPLAQTKQYRIWLGVFAFMALCILTLVTDPLFVPVAFWVPFLPFRWIDIFFCYFLSGLGVIAALVWFRRQAGKAERLPKTVPILLAVLLVFAAGVVLFYWTCARSPDTWFEMWERIPVRLRLDNEPFISPQLAICYSCPFIVLIGIYSLIKARTGDRRWAAVYVLAMAVVLIARMALEFSHSMDITFTIEDEFRKLMLRCAIASAAGVVGTGAALC